MYAEKHRNFQNLSKKMDKEDLVAMEDKLEKTAMGLLFDKEKYKAISSQERKVFGGGCPDDAYTFLSDAFDTACSMGN